MKELTQKLVKELFNYKDGILYWKINKAQCIQIGDKAGSFNKNNGYYSIKINYKLYLNHRIIFLYHHGYIPEFLDHIDQNRLNNNIENLRSATKRENAQNRIDKNSSSIYKGVFWDKKVNKWKSQIQINGKKKYLGSFNDEKAAAFIYNVYARGYFGKFANLNDLGVIKNE